MKYGQMSGPASMPCTFHLCSWQCCLVRRSRSGPARVVSKLQHVSVQKIVIQHPCQFPREAWHNLDVAAVIVPQVRVVFAESTGHFGAVYG